MKKLTAVMRHCDASRATREWKIAARHNTSKLTEDFTAAVENVCCGAIHDFNVSSRPRATLEAAYNSRASLIFRLRSKVIEIFIARCELGIVIEHAICCVRFVPLFQPHP